MYSAFSRAGYNCRSSEDNFSQFTATCCFYRRWVWTFVIFGPRYAKFASWFSSFIATIRAYSILLVCFNGQQYLSYPALEIQKVLPRLCAEFLELSLPHRMVFECAKTLCNRIYFGKLPISAFYRAELILFQTDSHGHSPPNLLNRKMRCCRAFSKRADSCHFAPLSLEFRSAHIFCCYRNQLFKDLKTWVSRHFSLEQHVTYNFHFWCFLRLFDFFYFFFQQNRTSLSNQTSSQPFIE